MNLFIEKTIEISLKLKKLNNFHESDACQKKRRHVRKFLAK